MKILLQSLSDEYSDARELLAAVDKGGIPMIPAKLRRIAEALGLEVKRTESPESIVSRIRAAVARADSQNQINQPDREVKPKVRVRKAPTDGKESGTKEKRTKSANGTAEKPVNDPEDVNIGKKVAIKLNNVVVDKGTVAKVLRAGKVRVGGVSQDNKIFIITAKKLGKLRVPVKSSHPTPFANSGGMLSIRITEFSVASKLKTK